MRRIKRLISSVQREFLQVRAMLFNYISTIQSYKNSVRRASCWLCLSVVSWTMLMGLSACGDEWQFSADEKYYLSFSEQMVDMDTVFTGVGSSTVGFMVYNANEVGVRFDAVLGGGANSPFRMNVDGEGGAVITHLEIAAHDSLFCFVQVNIPRNYDTPILQVTDSIRFVLESGVVQYVGLTASGLNARVFQGKTITADTLFTAEFPYLIYDTLTVASGATLTIQPGANLYFHKDAVLNVAGRMVAQGTPDSVVLMRGDRLDQVITDLPYDLLDGQWGGIILGTHSYDNLFEYCDIHSGTFGIRADSSCTDNLKMSVVSSMIHNVSGNGIEATQCKLIVANTQITNAGECCVNLAGGDSEFMFCTIAGFSLWNVGAQAVKLSDQRDGVSTPIKNALFNSCIITGRHATEFVVDVADSIRDLAPFSVAHSLLMVQDTTDVRYENVVFERVTNSRYGATNFVDGTLRGYSSIFQLDSLSMARGIAHDASSLWLLDLAGVERPLVGADAGCYQYVSKNTDE